MKYYHWLWLAPIILSQTACYETTGTQRDYVEARDSCRENAELRLGSSRGANPESQEYKKELLLAFSQCMNKNGWSVTKPDRGETPPAVSAVPAPVTVAPLTTHAQPTIVPQTRRAAECAYARQAQHHSSNARAIVKACEAECRNQKRVAPDMPTPPACQ